LADEGHRLIAPVRAAVAFVAGLIGAGLLLRGVDDWGLGFLCAAAALVAFRARVSALRRVETALAIALVLAGAVGGRPAEGLGAAIVAVLLIEPMRIF
jgi:hypothetical protein